MRIVIFGKEINEKILFFFKQLVKELQARELTVVVHEQAFIEYQQNAVFSELDLEFSNVIFDDDIVITFGGDGTFLEAITLKAEPKTKFLGINLGRLGFLANISKDNISEAVKSLVDGDFSVEQRALLELNSHRNYFPCYTAFNDITINRANRSMIEIQACINNQHINTYRSDGLIIATPSGSTAYSMSVGGPILPPDCKNIILTPIAPHNLTVRPIVVKDNKEFVFLVEGRGDEFTLSLDSRQVSIPMSDNLVKIKKSDKYINFINMNSNNFFNTLRDKLMWGADYRDYKL